MTSSPSKAVDLDLEYTYREAARRAYLDEPA